MNSDDILKAYELGTKGAKPTEQERLLFEAWMRGHCWAVMGIWNGHEYDDRPMYKEAKTLDPTAMQNRQLFAAWRDRAALSMADQPCKTCAHFKQGVNQVVGIYDIDCYECKHYYASKFEATP